MYVQLYVYLEMYSCKYGPFLEMYCCKYFFFGCKYFFSGTFGLKTDTHTGVGTGIQWLLI